MNCIKWLNENQGFVMAILTLVYVITTIGIAYLTLRNTNISKDHLDKVAEIEKNRLRPYIIFNISTSTTRKIAFASIKNLGLTAAYNIKLSISPKLFHSFNAEAEFECAFITSNILFLPPSEEVIDVLGNSPSFHQTYPNPKFEGFVEYEDSTKNKYKELFALDLSYLKDRIFTDEESVISELKQTNQILAKIVLK